MEMLLSDPVISVITPLYNSSVFIRETLDSLLAQTYTNWEAVLIDDGSTDDTARVVEPYLADQRFVYLRQENQGIAGARNTGIRAATGEWVCLLDHDDRWLPAKLERQLRYALAHGCDIVCTDAFIVKGAERRVYSRDFPDVAAQVQRAADGEGGVDVFEQLIKLNFLCTCSVMSRRSMFDGHGLFDPQAAPADDYEMWLRCMPGAKIGFLDEPLVEYQVHESNYSNDQVRMLEKIIYVLRKHRRRHADDERRVRQFNEALLFNYEALFAKLLDRRERGIALRRAVALLRDGPAGLRLLTRVGWTPLILQLLNSD